MATQYWLMKSEPGVYSIDDLKKDKKTGWDSIRNYQARNFMRDDMKVGDKILFYHSNATPPGVAGLGRVVKLAYPDPTQFDKKSKYFDPKSSKDDARWVMVDVGFVEKFPELLPLEDLKANAKLKDLLVIKRGQRLSIQPVKAKDYKEICKMAGAKKG